MKGWSLGGVLSLEVAHNLAQSSDIQVLGVIMIDSIFPQAFSKHDARVAPSEPIFASETGAEMRRRVSRSFEMAVAMVNGWVPPVWKGCSDPDTYARRAKVEADLTARLGARNGIQQDARRNLATECSMAIDDLPSPPRTVLLRCSEHVPVSQPNTISRVDVTREREKLGWEDYGYDLISAVIGVPGNHFNLFGEGNVSDAMIIREGSVCCSLLICQRRQLEEISSRIKLACRKLERGDC
jgi:thioesterase domain-containing protein